MEKLIAILFSIVLLAGCATVPSIPPYTGPDHDVSMETLVGPIDKIIAEASPTVVLRRYIIRTSGDTKIGIYKIEVGDQEKIKQALWAMTYKGFHGITYQPKPDMLGFLWTKARIDITYEYGVPPGDMKKKVSDVEDITAFKLPRGLNTLSAKHVRMLESINIYDEYPESLSIFINAEVTIPDAYLLMYAIKEVVE